MTRQFSTKTLVGFSIFITLILFAFSGSHPTTGSGGYTGAPNDNVCTTCHTPGGPLDGNITIGGLPGSVMANTTYPLTITVTNTAGSAVRAGFQMVSLKANLANGGTFSVPATENNAQVKTAAGKSYVGHQPSKNFTGNTATFDVEWTAPASATGDITVYAAAIIANGAGNSNDKFVVTNMSVTLGGGGDPLTGTFSSIIDASCWDSDDGQATINAMGGSGNYMYNWDNGETTATAFMLTSGDHSVTVTDDSSNEIVETVNIGAPTQIMPSILFQNDATCNGEMSGSAELIATGGSPGYFYNWGNGVTGAIQNNLAAGNYLVTVSDFHECQEFINVIIGEPEAIVINIITLDEPTCHGDDDGMISVEATGGNGGFSYNWLDAIGVPNGGTLSLIPAGDYQVEVIDQEGCTNQTTITLGQPDEVFGNILLLSDVQCFGGDDGGLMAEGEGGSGSYTYEWSNGGSGDTQLNLVAGTYQVTISDTENCQIALEVEVSQPVTAIEAGISIISQPNCGNQDGELSAFATGGTPGYTYLWSDNSTNAVLSNIGSGMYTVLITDQNDCTSEFTINLEDNDGITLAANDVGNNTCFGGSEGTATISASGGSGTYTFDWSNGGTNATENNLPAGDYTITVTDEDNCTGEISIEITQPDAFMANETLTNITCNGVENGSIQLNATGGTGDLTYLWNTGDTTDGIVDLIPGIFSVIITDANNCTGEIEFVISEPDAISAGAVDSGTPSCPGDMDGYITIDPSGGTGNLSILWSTGDTTNTTDNLAAGDYSVSITDENNCEVDFDFTLDDATVLSAAASGTPPTCNDGEDGSATLTLIGGSGNYSIVWSTGDSTLTIENLSAGTYSATITDGNNCFVETDLTIIAPPAIDPNISSTNETTNGAVDGTAMADPQNGSAPYTYLWSTGETTQSIQNLAPDSYQVTITDADGCMVVGTAVVNNGDCNLEAVIVSQDITCFGFSDGSIVITVNNAVEPVEYLWSNDSTSASLINLDPGAYGVTITDANNCQVQITDLEIMEPSDIIASDVTITDASNPASSDGSIEVEFSGGTGEFTIEYTDGDGNPIAISSFENLQSGMYGAIVTDDNGCQKFFGPYEVGVLSAVDDIDLRNSNIFPNPAQSFFIIETDAQLITSPGIYSVTGQLIESSFERVLNKYTFDSSLLHNGVYYVKLVSETDIVLKKIIIAK